MDNKTLDLSKHSIMMEDIKFKFLGLINKQSQTKIPSMGVNPELLNPKDSEILKETESEASRSTDSQVLPDQEILESIEQIYYDESDGTFDPCRYELEKLPNVLDSKDIERYYKKLKQQHQVVSKKVLQLILQKQKNCNDEFDKILTIEQQLQDLLSICRIGRTDLELARKQFTTASLGILANYRKRQIVEDLLRSLTTIKTLQRTEDRVQELLSEQNYPGAISLILECQNAAKTYKHFGCITALTGKLQDTLEQVEQALDATLERMCMQFDGATYASVQDAYYLLGKPETAIDQLHIHFTAAIHHTAFSAVYAHAAAGDPKRQFNQLCQEVSHSNFLPCLEELCKSLWAILSSYHSIVQWHKFKRASDPEQELEASIDKQYAKKKLQNGIVRIWNDVESKISTYLRATTLTHFKFEQFVQILSIVNRLLEIGDKLYGSKSENLQESIRQQCLSYFSHYHALRLDELRIFLEHDGWEMCPVKSTFAVTQLQEFKSLGHVLNSSRNWNNLSDSLSETDSSTSSNANAWLQKCLDEGTSPFGIGLDDTMDEDILNIQDQVDNYFSEESDDDDDVPDELKRDCIDEFEYTKVNKKRHKVRYNGPLVTNTTLSVLRVCGKYLQMIRLLRSIAMTVIESMIQFYELYFFAVHKFFTTDIVPISQSGDYLYSKKLNLTLSRIKNNLIIDDNDEKHLEGKHKVKQPHLSSIVNLSDSEKLYGLAERAAAVESLIFLGQQYENFKSYFEYLTVNSPWSELQQFYAQTIASAGDLRRPIYMQVAYQSIDTKYILQLISKVNWEVRDVMSQHSEYVDVLLQKIKMLRTKLNEIGNNVPLPKEAYTLVWENVAFLISRTLVDGFSGAKKCSNGGRALMQLDYTQLASEFENVTSLRPMPFKEYIESYVKAYYLTENVLLAWIQEKKEYTSKHKIGLISCVCQNKKVRQRMIALIEEEQKPITRLHIKSINR